MPASAALARSGETLVGREQHFAALKDAYRTLEREREPLAVFISGRSGEGKTALGEHFGRGYDVGLFSVTAQSYDGGMFEQQQDVADAAFFA